MLTIDTILPFESNAVGTTHRLVRLAMRSGFSFQLEHVEYYKVAWSHDTSFRWCPYSESNRDDEITKLA